MATLAKMAHACYLSHVSSITPLPESTLFACPCPKIVAAPRKPYDSHHSFPFHHARPQVNGYAAKRDGRNSIVTAPIAVCITEGEHMVRNPARIHHRKLECSPGGEIPAGASRQPKRNFDGMLWGGFLTQESMPISNDESPLEFKQYFHPG